MRITKGLTCPMTRSDVMSMRLTYLNFKEVSMTHTNAKKRLKENNIFISSVVKENQVTFKSWQTTQYLFNVHT